MSNLTPSLPVLGDRQCRHLTEQIFLFFCSIVSELINYQSKTMEYKDEGKNTPLHLACKNGHLEVAKMLLAPRLLLEKYVNT